MLLKTWKLKFIFLAIARGRGEECLISMIVCNLESSQSDIVSEIGSKI